MTIKNIIIAAATVAITASAGAADTFFEQGRTLEASNVLDLGKITADAAGVVEVYDFHGGQKGALLGSDDLRAGTNTDVRVNTALKTKRDVLAVITVGGQVVASQEFDVN